MLEKRREISAEEFDLLQIGAFLWVWDASACPPHIGMSVDGSYFSLRFTKKDVQPVAEVLDKVKRLPISFLWFEFDKHLLKKETATVFSNYTTCLEQNLSCLQPILDSFGLENHSYILKDLLAFIDEHKGIRAIYSHRISRDWKGLVAYTNKEVQANLDAAKEKLCLK